MTFWKTVAAVLVAIVAVVLICGVVVAVGFAVQGGERPGNGTVVVTPSHG